MRLFWRRRPTETPKEAALARAKRAAASIRRDRAEVERYRVGKQAQPADRMTSNQWLGGGGT